VTLISSILSGSMSAFIAEPLDHDESSDLREQDAKNSRIGVFCDARSCVALCAHTRRRY
jgi:hypothetical protein